VTLSSLLTDDVDPLPLVAVAGADILLWYVRYLGENDPVWKGFVANIFTVIGSAAFLIALAVLFSAVIAAVLALVAVTVFMLPLFALAGASSTSRSRGRRGYRRDPYGNDYY
jgi:hypothetical protein